MRVTVLLALTLATPRVRAADLTEVRPPGGQRGTTVEVTFLGRHLAAAEEVLFELPGLDVESIVHREAEKVVARLRISPECRLGEHTLRLRTRTGVTQMATFWVGPFPEVEEEEPNSELEAAQAVDLNVTVTGRITREDVDCFTLEAREGQRIVAEVEGMRLGRAMFDPHLAILDASGAALAVSDDSALHLQDGVAALLAPADGRYVIQLRDSAYGGDNRSWYRLHIGSFPRPLAVWPGGCEPGRELALTYFGDPSGPIQDSLRVPGHQHSGYPLYLAQHGLIPPSPNALRVMEPASVLEVEPNDAREQATDGGLVLPIAFDGRLERPGDEDWFHVRLPAGKGLRARVLGRALRSPVDSVLSLYKESGEHVATDDDSAGGVDSVVDFATEQEAGLFLRVTDHLRDGGPTAVYRVEITERRPSLNLSIPRFGRDSQERQVVPVAQGNRYATVLRVRRREIGGAVALEIEDAPPGVVVHAPDIPAEVEEVPVVFEAAPDAALAGSLARMVGRIGEARGIYQNRAELVVSDPNRTVYYAVTTNHLPVAITEPVPFRVHVTPPRGPLPRNGEIVLRVRVERDEGFAEPVTVRMLWNPPGVGSSATITLAGDQTEGGYPVNADGNAALGNWSLALLGEAAVEGELRLASTELFPLSVAEPFVTGSLEMSVVEQGKPGEVLCKLEAEEGFPGGATLSLVNLPPNVTSSPFEIAADSTEIVFPLATDATAPVGKHARVFCRAVFAREGEEVVQNLAYGGVLRIDPATAAAEAPAPEPEEKAAERPRLSRLEQLRADAQARGERTASENQKEDVDSWR